MIKPGRGKWTDQQILDAIHAINGASEIKFRYDVLRGGIRRASVAAEGSINLNRFDDIQRTARFTLYEEVDWLRDEIKPCMLLRMEDELVSAPVIAQTWDERDALGYTFGALDALNLTWDELDAGRFKRAKWRPTYAEFPLGVFVLSTPTRTSSDGVTIWTVEAYDRTIILVEDSLVEPLYIPAGTAYLDAVQNVLVSAGIERVIITEAVNTQITVDRVFEIGISKLRVVNTLLSEINYNPIYCDVDGTFIISPYKEPSADQVSYTYRVDKRSIIGRDTTSDMDYYKVPNVFIAVCSNPDIGTVYTSVYVNDNPASRLSTVQRGRRITSEIYRPDAIASQEDLDAYIRRIAFEASQVYEPLQFVTALNPLHERAEVLQIQHPDATGVFVESGWEMTLAADGQMIHNVRRLVTL